MTDSSEEPDPNGAPPSARLAELHRQIAECVEEMSRSDSDDAILRIRKLVVLLSVETERLQQDSKSENREQSNDWNSRD